jgi:hypothetical protein
MSVPLLEENCSPVPSDALRYPKAQSVAFRLQSYAVQHTLRPPTTRIHSICSPLALPINQTAIQSSRFGLLSESFLERYNPLALQK